MRAGILDRLIKVQRQSATEDDWGVPVSGWVEVATVWASVKHASGLETVKSGVNVSVVKASIRIRRRTDVTAGMRVLCEGKVYDIRAVLEDVSDRVYTDLVCELGANNG
ncbi:phage head closure protein [Pusillimonas sp. DMV24BSW_D]|uniref:phage head closure protein n=1 Tax=Neopusillimonas aestuarii TaxID=2716226 RepID=UPI00140DA8C8|nr:phage head closure protein [Pusillimonas sp. DMV24BSW_D]QIM48986.1 phage head closure protein [Pusillimonas sp. DMV24BSW_D]